MVTKTVVGQQRAAAKREAAKAASDKEIEALIGGGGGDDLDGISDEASVVNQKLDLSDVFAGVSVSWLAHAFQMDRVTCKKKLAQCPPLRKERGAPIYSLRQAAAYLVPPKVDVAAYIKGMNPKELPHLLQDAYWSAMIKRQTWEERAGQLWRTEKVLQVFAQLARELKTSITLWADNIESITGLSNEQMALLNDESDAVLRIIHKVLLDAPSRGLTPSSVVEQDEDSEKGSADDAE